MSRLPLHLYLKRIVDIVLSVILLIILSSVLILISFAIILESSGSPIFTQSRIGLKRKIFKIMKFRTMVVNAENIGTGIYTHEGDSRITRVGRFLRKYSLDELPQLFNIFIGQMSFIGPRPPLPIHPYTIDQYPMEYVKRFDMRPGISGLAQISGRTNITWEERFVFDLDYVSNFSIFLDIKIIFITILKIIKKDDVYPTMNYINKNHKLK